MPTVPNVWAFVLDIADCTAAVLKEVDSDVVLALPHVITSFPASRAVQAVVVNNLPRSHIQVRSVIAARLKFVSARPADRELARPLDHEPVTQAQTQTLSLVSHPHPHHMYDSVTCSHTCP